MVPDCWLKDLRPCEGWRALCGPASRRFLDCGQERLGPWSSRDVFADPQYRRMRPNAALADEASSLRRHDGEGWLERLALF